MMHSTKEGHQARIAACDTASISSNLTACLAHAWICGEYALVRETINGAKDDATRFRWLRETSGLLPDKLRGAFDDFMKG